MTCIAVTVADGCTLTPAAAATMCKAVDAQAQEFAEAWGVPYTPVLFFSNDVLMKLTDEELTAFVADCRLLTIQPTLDAPGALGYHDDVAGVIFARVLDQGDATATTLSHEVLEEMGDPTCDEWTDMGHGVSQAREACDRVEGDTYSVETDGTFVPLSNYLLPSAFVVNGKRPYDRLGKLHDWDGMTPGGYMIRRDATGDVTDVFAATPAGAATVEAKMANSLSRAARRLGQLPLEPSANSDVTPAETPKAKKRRRA